MTPYDDTLTLREYHAAHAPAVPDWFEVDPRRPAPQMPRCERWLTSDPICGLNNPQADKECKLIESWMRDPCYDLPDHLRGFQQAFEVHHATLKAWRDENSITRIVAWRYAYADAMIEESTR